MLLETVRILRRLWAWVLAAVVLAAGAGIGTAMAVPPMQQSMAQVLFVPSAKQPGVKDLTNPFLSLGGSVAVVASLIQISVSDDQTAQALSDQGFHAEFEVAPNLSENAGPVLVITTEDQSARMAQSTLFAVVSAIQADLDSLQDDQDVAPDLRVQALVLTSTEIPLVIRKTQIQSAAAATASTFLVLVGLLLLNDRRRRTKAVRRRRTAPGDVEPGTQLNADGSWPASPRDNELVEDSLLAEARARP